MPLRILIALAATLLCGHLAAQLQPDSVFRQPRGVLSPSWARHGVLEVGYSPRSIISGELRVDAYETYLKPVPFLSVGYVHAVAQPLRLREYFVGPRTARGFGAKLNVPVAQWADLTLGFEALRMRDGARLSVPRYVLVEDPGSATVQRLDVYEGALRFETSTVYLATRFYPVRFVYLELGLGYGRRRFRLDSDNRQRLHPPRNFGGIFFTEDPPLDENRWHVREEATLRLSVGVVL